MLQWLPTTGEFGLYGTFGDYDWHEKLATRLGVHFTRSLEDGQNQPGTDSIENSQIRLTDGSTIFTPNLFGPGITVEKVMYRMASLDGGLKYKGMSLEAEYYWRWLDEFQGVGVGGIEDIDDDGFQVQASAMAIRDVLQVYAGTSVIDGIYGDGSEVRAGANWYPMKQRGIRVNAEWLHLNDCPVGYTAVPYPVGGNGDVYPREPRDELLSRGGIRSRRSALGLLVALAIPQAGIGLRLQRLPLPPDELHPGGAPTSASS